MIRRFRRLESYLTPWRAGTNLYLHQYKLLNMVLGAAQVKTQDPFSLKSGQEQRKDVTGKAKSSLEQTLSRRKQAIKTRTGSIVEKTSRRLTQSARVKALHTISGTSSRNNLDRKGKITKTCTKYEMPKLQTKTAKRQNHPYNNRKILGRVVQ